MTTFTVLLQSAPYAKDNKAWHALRFGCAAISLDIKVKLHLLDAAVELCRPDQTVPEGAVNLEELLKELLNSGVDVQACGKSLKEYKIEESDMIAGIKKGSMCLLADWVKDSDKVISF